MGIALVIKNASFSTNRIDVIDLNRGTDAERFQRFIDNLSYLTDTNVAAKTTGATAAGKTYIGIEATANIRRTIVLADSFVNNDEIYNSVSGSIYDGSSLVSPYNDTYTFLPVPPGIKTVTFGFTNSAYSVGGVLITSSNKNVSDSGWKAGGTTGTIDVSSYDSTVWIALNTKKNSGSFTGNETLASLGFSIQFTY